MKKLALLIICITAVRAQAQSCSIVCEGSPVYGDTWITEQGTLSNPLYKHETAINWSAGGANSNGPAISCGVTVAAAVMSCLFSCAVSITFNATANGLGTTVNFPAGNVFAKQYAYTTTCAAKSGSVGQCTSYDYSAPASLWNASGTTGHSTLSHTAYSTLSGFCWYADQGSGGDGGGGGCESNGDCEPHTCCDVASGTCSASACGQQGETRRLSKSWQLVEPGAPGFGQLQIH